MTRLGPLGCALALAVTGLAACQTPPSTPDETPASGAVTAESTATAPTPDPNAPTGAVLALDTEGLRVVDAASGSTTALAFGMEMESAVEAVTRLRGATRERGVNGECGAGPLDTAMWPDGLSLLAAEGSFSGWSLGMPVGTPGATPAATPLSTMSGIGIGTTRGDLAGAYEVRVEETTLGTEFSAGDLFGLLSGPGADATITNLWSGVSCVFR